ncbi:hypothetical protein ACWF9G_23065 [Nocardia sp. NPDC055029]
MIAIGYLRLALVGESEVGRVEHRLGQCADRAGLHMHEVLHEPAPPRNPLLATMEAIDHRHGTQLIATLTDFAARDAIDLRPVLGGQASYRVLWAAVEKLQEGRGGHLIVPSLSHLDGFVVPRPTLLRRISDLQPIVSLMDASSVDHIVVDAEEVVVEFEVPPAPLAEEIARATTRSGLTRAELPHMVEPLDVLMRELVGPATEPDHLASQGHLLTIRIERDPTVAALVVTCLDTRGAMARTPPHPELVKACARVVRTPWGSGTSTRCELPLPALHRNGRADAVAGV